MKNLIALGLFLCLGFGTLAAQSTGTPSFRKGDGFQLRDLLVVLELDNEQMATLKNYYGATSDLRRVELTEATTDEQRRDINRHYQHMRDEKVRSLLNSTQMALFDSYVEERESGEREAETAPEGGN